MILNLPFEVILGIAKHVSFGDKPHLMRTCRRLHDIVSKASTEYLDLMGYGGNTDMLVRKFRSRDFDGSKVKILRIDLDTLSDEIYNQLPEIFPTVARVINRNNLCFENPNTVCPLLKWKKSIEVCRTSEDWWAVFNFLEQDSLPILNELEIGHEEDDFRMEEIDNTLYFLPFIANAPSLTMLTLFNCDISLDLLEKVHDACPHIKYLELSNIFIHINDDILPQDIKLATQMTHLKVWNDTTLFDPKCVFQDYILAKYPNLLYLQLNVNCDAQKVEKSLRELYSGCSGTFDSDNDDDYDDGEEETNRLVESKMEVFTNTIDAYRAQGERLMSNLPESIKTLKVNTTIFDNVMEALDQANINPIKLEFKESREASPSVFKTSNQLGYLKKLAALRTLEVSFKSSMQKYNQDLASTFITKLIVGFAGAKSFQTIDLGWLLSLFPSLEILNIKHSDAKVKGGSDIEKTYPKLRRLSISNSPTHRNLLGYIEKVAPRLAELRWTVVGKLEYEHPRKLNPIKDVHTLDLSGYQNLETFDLTLSSKTFKKVFLFNCSISLQKENHSLICTNFGRIKELDETDCLDHMTAVNIICGNIRELKIQNTLIANQHGFVPFIA